MATASGVRQDCAQECARTRSGPRPNAPNVNQDSYVQTGLKSSISGLISNRW